MCGILGCRIKEMKPEVIKKLYEIFLNQKNRGIKGAGVSISNTDTFYRFRSISPFRLFNAYNMAIWQKVIDNSSVLVHHRFPTSTDNEAKLNHPIANEDNTIHLIHNGMINNDRELRKELEARGHVFECVDDNNKITDSEVILHVFEDGMDKNDNDVSKAIKHMHDKVSGCMAIAVNIKGFDDIYLFRWQNPLVVFKDNQDNVYFASTLDKKDKRFEVVHEFENGEIGKIGSDGFEVLEKLKVEYVKHSKGDHSYYDWQEDSWRFNGKFWYYNDTTNSKKNKRKAWG